MPTLVKKPGSETWYIRFRHNGTDRLKSTGETDRRKARKQLKAADAEVRLDRTVDDHMEEILAKLKNMPDAVRREEARVRLLSKLQQAAERKLLITDAWAKWLEIPKDTGEATISGYKSVWQQFASWLSASRPSYSFLGQVTAPDAGAYSKHLWSTNCTGRTFNLHVSFLNRFWRELKTEGLVENVWKDIEKRLKNTVSHEALSREELTKIIQDATGELKGMLLVGLLSSLRLKDVVFLDSSKFIEAEGILKLRPFKTKRLDKWVRIPVHPQLLPLLREPGENGLYFPQTAKEYANDPSAVSKSIQAHFEKNGIKTTEAIADGVRRKREGVKYGFHSLRFSFVSICARAGTPQHVLSELVGHSSPSMTLHYSRSNGDDRSKAIGHMPTIEV
jgi:integrase